MRRRCRRVSGSSWRRSLRRSWESRSGRSLLSRYRWRLGNSWLRVIMRVKAIMPKRCSTKFQGFRRTDKKVKKNRAILAVKRRNPHKMKMATSEHTSLGWLKSISNQIKAQKEKGSKQWVRTQMIERKGFSSSPTMNTARCWLKRTIWRAISSHPWLRYKV